ncbi:hypothetical protein AAU61_17745 [Desulfocarbo indianensis]|nr:hypothetical protein AAU61_17745 [Desulfocarbo indianensis]
MSQTDVIEQFRQEAKAASARVFFPDNLEQALAYAVDLAREQNRGGLAAPGLPAAAGDRLAGLCQEAGVPLVQDGLRAAADEIGIGLTLADWGVAETGTLIIDSRSEELRLATMLPLAHVALLSRDKIVARLTDIAAELARLMTGTSYLAFITGPSRTADIERVLTIGVHGPAQLHVLILPEGEL